MTDVDVRPATPADAEGVRRVAERGWRAAYDGVLADDTIETALDAWYDLSALRRSLRDDVAAFVAADDGTVGYARGGVEGDVATLGALYVDPERWQEGVGTALCDAFEARARDAGCAAVRLVVLADNDGGRAFYAARGYERVARRTTDLFGERAAELVLRKRLD